MHDYEPKQRKIVHYNFAQVRFRDFEPTHMHLAFAYAAFMLQSSIYVHLAHSARVRALKNRAKGSERPFGNEDMIWVKNSPF